MQESEDGEEFEPTEPHQRDHQQHCDDQPLRNFHVAESAAGGEALLIHTALYELRCAIGRRAGPIDRGEPGRQRAEAGARIVKPSALEEVGTKVIRSRSVRRGVLEEARNHDGIVIGAAGQSFSSRTLFGTIPEGIELPTGAVWRPTLWVFGSNRLGVPYRDDQGGGRNFGSVVNRLALFGQLNFTGTERIQIGIRPTDEEEGRPLLAGREYTSYFWKTHTLAGGRTIDGLDGWNGDLNVAYFEGQLDEIFPNLDPYDTEFLDLGFSVGRQAMSFQRGLMVNEDMIDAVTVTRNTLYGNGNLNLRVTGVFAWNRLTRVSPFPNTDAKMYGIFTESDFRFNTLNVDIGFVNDPNRSNRDVLVAGISSTQRLVGYHNTYNSRFHILASWPTEGEGVRTAFMGSPGNVTGQGELFTQ